MVTGLPPVSVSQLGLERVEEETQKPDGSCETPFRPVTCSSLKETGKQVCFFFFFALTEITAALAAAGVRS